MHSLDLVGVKEAEGSAVVVSDLKENGGGGLSGEEEEGEGSGAASER